MRIHYYAFTIILLQSTLASVATLISESRCSLHRRTRVFKMSNSWLIYLCLSQAQHKVKILRHIGKSLWHADGRHCSWVGRFCCLLQCPSRPGLTVQLASHRYSRKVVVHHWMVALANRFVMVFANWNNKDVLNPNLQYCSYLSSQSWPQVAILVLHIVVHININTFNAILSSDLKLI